MNNSYYNTTRSLRPRRSAPTGNVIWIFGAMVAIVVIVIAVALFSGYGKHHSVTTTVDSKERVCSSSGNNGTDCKYLVFTDHGTYRITDAFLVGTTRFNSSDVYGRVKACHKYRIEYYGWRLPVFSSYPNIIKLDDLGRDTSCTE